MRTNLMARSLLTSPRVLPSTFRSFQTSSTLKNTAPAVTKEEDAPGPSAIIEKYGGALTFWGMIASIAVTKEVFILDAEFLLATEIAAFALATYVMAGDSVEKFCADQSKTEKDKFEDSYEFLATMLTQYKSSQQTNQLKPEILQQYLGEFKTAIAANAAYETVLPKHKARAEVMAVLEQIQIKEEHAASMAWASQVEEAVANVTEAFEVGLDSENNALQAETLEMAINNIGSKDPPADQIDPVKKLFMEQFPEDA